MDNLDVLAVDHVANSEPIKPWLRTRKIAIRLGLTTALLTGLTYDATTTDIEDVAINQECIDEYNAHIESEQQDMIASGELEEAAGIWPVANRGAHDEIAEEQANKTSSVHNFDFLDFIKNIPNYTRLLDYAQTQNFEVFSQMEVRTLTDGNARINEDSLNEHLQIALKLMENEHTQAEVRANARCFRRDLGVNRYEDHTMFFMVPADINSVIQNHVISDSFKDTDGGSGRGRAITIPPILFNSVEADYSMIIVLGDMRGRDRSEYDVDTISSQVTLHEVLGHGVFGFYSDDVPITKAGIDKAEKWAESVEQLMISNWHLFEHLDPIIDYGEQDQSILNQIRAKNRARNLAFLLSLFAGIMVLKTVSKKVKASAQ